MHQVTVGIFGDWLLWGTEDRIHFGSSVAEARFDVESGFFYSHLEPQGLVKLVPFYSRSEVVHGQ